MSNYLIVAPFSLLGEHLIEQLSKEDSKIIGLARNLKQKTESFPELASKLELYDISELTSPSTQFLSELDSLDYVYQLLPTTKESDLDYDRSLASLIEKSNSDPRIFLFGSRREYHTLEKVIGPNAPHEPCDIYGSLKLEEEKLFRPANVRAVYLKISNVYGPSQNFFDKNTFINIALRNAMKENKAFFDISEEDYIDFIHVKDLVRALESLKTQEGIDEEILFIGSGQKTYVRDIVEELREDFPGINVEIKPSEKVDFSFVFDNSKIKSIINWNPDIEFKRGLKELIGELNKKWKY